MSDEQRFEARFAAAYDRYLDGAPVAVDPRALTRAITAASPRIGTRRFFTVNIALRLVLVAALVGTASLAVSLSAGQNVTPQPGCATPLPPTSAPGASMPSPSAPTGQSPVEFLWSATGPADDPMRFDTAGDGSGMGGAIAIDRGCRIWVADTASGHDRFAIFTPDGMFLEYWGSTGTGHGQFLLRNAAGDGLESVAFAPDGSFYVLDPGNLRIQHFAEDRTFLGSWGSRGSDPGQYLDPEMIAVDGKGVVYVFDDGRDVVESYDRDGKVVGSLRPDAPLAAGGLAVDAKGDIYAGVCCSVANEVRRFAPDGTRLATIGAFGASRDPQQGVVALDADGRVFAVRSGPLVSGDRVRVYDPGGTLLGSFGATGSGDGEFGTGWLLGLALDGQANVYVTDPGRTRLQKFRLLPPLAR